ncbi:methyltransferase domain-containing protein [Methylobacterium sp. SyP6R]|uniref:methyltransferase domain-containing protein n=1 Tax=Methylobacterium sp. SyP6R TaxID=2718876 RepID=UPI001F022C75|nr:methyltransferase domain-containing protein [Methylobacterium sp. SyP6R]MCF4130109.1 methyltransferase domain-containing protein [Methylobacterium sp. SyP6R]
MLNPRTPVGPRSRSLHAQAWVEAYPLIDRQLSPLGLEAMAALAPSPGATVLDIGCGAGQTLGQLAEIVGASGQVIGVDVAQPLLAVAAQRTRSLPNVRVIEADAQTIDLPSGSADAVYSRFGVMGFADPVAAFTNFRRMLRPGGKLAFVCWQALDQNELDHLPLTAAGIPGVADDAPFSFADPRVIDGVLGQAGFDGIGFRAHNARVSSGDLDAMTAVLLKVGSLGKIVREHPTLRADAEPRLRAALAKLGDHALVSLTASVWIVTAYAP